MPSYAEGLSLAETQRLFTDNRDFRNRVSEIVQFTEKTTHGGTMAVYRTAGRLTVSKAVYPSPGTRRILEMYDNLRGVDNGPLIKKFGIPRHDVLLTLHSHALNGDTPDEMVLPSFSDLESYADQARLCNPALIDVIISSGARRGAIEAHLYRVLPGQKPRIKGTCTDDFDRIRAIMKKSGIHSARVQLQWPNVTGSTAALNQALTELY